MFGSPDGIRRAFTCAMAIIGCGAPISGICQQNQRVRDALPAPLAYPDILDLFGSAPLVVHAHIVNATRLADGARSADISRFYVEADVVALIRGPGGIPPRVSYIVDAPLDSRGKAPKLKKTDVLIAALPVAGRPGEIQLAARDAQVIWSATLDARVRTAVASVLAPDAAPVVTGVGSAFHVAGSILGEGETQVFLTTANGAPVSLSILRRPGEAPRWALALGEIVDESAGAPAQDTLAWYRLACFLPRILPDAAVSELSAADADVARQDYAFVMAQLGACTRTRR